MNPQIPPPPPPSVAEEPEQYEEIPPSTPPKDYPRSKTGKSASIAGQRTPPIPPRPVSPQQPAAVMGAAEVNVEFPPHLMPPFEVWYRQRLLDDQRRRGLNYFDNPSAQNAAAVYGPGNGEPAKKAPPTRPKRRPPPEVIAAIEARFRQEQELMKKEATPTDQGPPKDGEQQSSVGETAPRPCEPPPERRPPCRPFFRPKPMTEAMANRESW